MWRPSGLGALDTATQGVALGYLIAGFQPLPRDGFAFRNVVGQLYQLLVTQETRKHEGRQAVPKHRKLSAL